MSSLLKYVLCESIALFKDTIKYVVILLSNNKFYYAYSVLYSFPSRIPFWDSIQSLVPPGFSPYCIITSNTRSLALFLMLFSTSRFPHIAFSPIIGIVSVKVGCNSPYVICVCNGSYLESNSTIIIDLQDAV